MKIGSIIGIQQPNIYNNLNKNQTQTRHKKKKKNNSSQENLSFDDIENMMKHSSYKRCKGGAIKQIK